MKRKVNGTLEFYGYCVDLIKDIQAIMGFEYELYEVPDGKYGNMDSKMNWNGMIKELIEKVFRSKRIDCSIKNTIKFLRRELI